MMLKFGYKAVDPTGNEVTGTLKAETKKLAQEQLMRQGLAPIEVTQKKSLNIEITKKKVKKKELMHFTRQLAVFAKSGITLTTALTIIGEESKDDALRKACRQMTEDIRDGGTFSAAASLHENVFPPYYVGVLQSAEATGRLDLALDILADYIEREIETRQKIISALSYPMVVMALAIVTLIILAGFVLPQFVPLFEELGADLPTPTKMLLFVARFFGDLWWITLIFFVTTISVAIYFFSRFGKPVRDRVTVKMPIIREIVLFASLERFTAIMKTMLTVGVSLPRAMETTVGATPNEIYRAKFEEARIQMLEGGGFAVPIVATGLFPSATRQMFRVGEETGTLETQMDYASKYFARELQYKIQRLTALFEPALILFVGVIVGFVAIALVSAMYGVLGGIDDM